MLTEFGKVMRIMRINSGDSLRAMAEKLSLSAAYLSAMENGKRNIPSTLESEIVRQYGLSAEEQKELHTAIEASASTVKIDLTEMADKRKKLIRTLAKEDIDDATLTRLCQIIDGSSEEDLK